MIARKIIERHAGWTEQTGEWGHIQDGARKRFREILDAGDVDALDELLGRFFQDSVCSGLVSFDYRDVGKPGWDEMFRSDMVRNIWLWELHTGGDDPSRLEHQQAGSPLLGDVGGVLVQFDTPRHDHYAARLSALLPHGGTVVEIGGGYGGTALQLLKMRPDVHYVIIDIPETLYLAWYWLDAAGVDVGWWDNAEIRHYKEDALAHDVTLLPAGDFSKCLAADVVFSAHALCEMLRVVADGYLRWIRESCPTHFYHDSAHDLGIAWHPGYEGSTAEAFPEIQSTELDPGEAYREVYRAPTLWPGTGGRYWEFLYERR